MTVLDKLTTERNLSSVYQSQSVSGQQAPKECHPHPQPMMHIPHHQSCSQSHPDYPQKLCNVAVSAFRGEIYCNSPNQLLILNDYKFGLITHDDMH